MFQDMAAISLTLKPFKHNKLPVWLGQAVQAFFLHSLENLNERLSAAAHDGPNRKAFTASNLSGMELQGDTARISPMRQLTLRFTTIHPHLSALMLNGLVPTWCAHGIHLHDQPMAVTDVQIEPNDNPWCGCTSYAQLLADAHPKESRITLVFASPTAFKATAGHFVPLPQPELVFGSLMDRWNSYAPQGLPESLRIVIRNKIAVESASINTSEVSFGRGNRGLVIGFVGKVTYYIREQSQEVRCMLHTLASFAKYSGVGAKTTVGLGQVRVC